MCVCVCVCLCLRSAGVQEIGHGREDQGPVCVHVLLCVFLCACVCVCVWCVCVCLCLCLCVCVCEVQGFKTKDTEEKLKAQCVRVSVYVCVRESVCV